MDVNPDSPWNPRIPVDISPADFEKLALEWLRRSAERQKSSIATKHLAGVQGNAGQYEIDVLVTFSALGGASFVVLVECKCQVRPVEREDVMVLESRLRDVNAQKGMLISPSGFQSGALEFAAAKHIATIAVVRGKWLYQTRAAGAGPVEPPPWVHFDPYAGILMTKTQTGVTHNAIEMARVDAIVEWLADNVATDAQL